MLCDWKLQVMVTKIKVDITTDANSNLWKYQNNQPNSLDFMDAYEEENIHNVQNTVAIVLIFADNEVDKNIVVCIHFGWILIVVSSLTSSDLRLFFLRIENLSIKSKYCGDCWIFSEVGVGMYWNVDIHFELLQFSNIEQCKASPVEIRNN